MVTTDTGVVLTYYIGDVCVCVLLWLLLSGSEPTAVATYDSSSSQLCIDRCQADNVEPGEYGFVDKISASFCVEFSLFSCRQYMHYIVCVFLPVWRNKRCSYVVVLP